MSMQDYYYHKRALIIRGHVDGYITAREMIEMLDRLDSELPTIILN